MFNKSLDNLPHSLTNLTLGYNFYKLLSNLPYNLIEIIIDKKSLKLLKKYHSIVNLLFVIDKFIFYKKIPTL